MLAMKYLLAFLMMAAAMMFGPQYAFASCDYMSHNNLQSQAVAGIGHSIMHGNYFTTPYSGGQKTSNPFSSAYSTRVTFCVSGVCDNVTSSTTDQQGVWRQATGTDGWSILASEHYEVWTFGSGLVCRSAI